MSQFRYWDPNAQNYWQNERQQYWQQPRGRGRGRGNMTYSGAVSRGRGRGGGRSWNDFRPESSIPVHLNQQQVQKKGDKKLDDETRAEKERTASLVKNRLQSLTTEDKTKSMNDLLTKTTQDNEDTKDQPVAKQGDKRIAHVRKPIRVVPRAPQQTPVQNPRRVSTDQNVKKDQKNIQRKLLQDLMTKPISDLKGMATNPKPHDTLFLSHLVKTTRLSLSQAMRKLAEYKLSANSSTCMLTELENLVDADIAVNVWEMPIDTIRTLSQIFDLNLDGDASEIPGGFGSTTGPVAQHSWHTPQPFHAPIRAENNQSKENGKQSPIDVPAETKIPTVIDITGEPKEKLMLRPINSLLEVTSPRPQLTQSPAKPICPSNEENRGQPDMHSKSTECRPAIQNSATNNSKYFAKEDAPSVQKESPAEPSIPNPIVPSVSLASKLQSNIESPNKGSVNKRKEPPNGTITPKGKGKKAKSSPQVNSTQTVCLPVEKTAVWKIGVVDVAQQTENLTVERGTQFEAILSHRGEQVDRNDFVATKSTQVSLDIPASPSTSPFSCLPTNTTTLGSFTVEEVAKEFDIIKDQLRFIAGDSPVRNLVVSHLINTANALFSTSALFVSNLPPAGESTQKCNKRSKNIWKSKHKKARKGDH